MAHVKEEFGCGSQRNKDGVVSLHIDFELSDVDQVVVHVVIRVQNATNEVQVVGVVHCVTLQPIAISHRLVTSFLLWFVVHVARSHL